MNDPLDDLIHTLRSVASSAELEGMSAAVDAMHHALLDESELLMTPAANATPSKARPRRMQVVTLVAAGVLGFAGVAAAGPGGFLTDDTPETTRPETTTATTSTPETTVPESTVPESTAAESTVPESTAAEIEASETTAAEGAPEGVLVDDPDTDFDETLCAEGNHGQTVSSVAHDTEPGPDHGDAVREAAQSSCGKDDDDGSTDDTDDSSDDVDADDSQRDNNGSDNNGPDNNGPDNNGPDNNGPDNNGSDNNGSDNNGSDGEHGNSGNPGRPASGD